MAGKTVTMTLTTLTNRIGLQRNLLESGLTVVSINALNCKNEQSSEVRRQQVVAFRVLEDEAMEEGGKDEPETLQAKSEAQPKVKKGSCYRCHKGNRFTEKEVCIVCDAKYCSDCVLEAMGLMTEGRKCITCIGFPIDESKRRNLGKSSRMLKRVVLSEFEIKRIMQAEKFCDANQLPPEKIFVNGKPLNAEELIRLHACSNPPKKLKARNYWYDEATGFWGKEGHKPSKIISPHLNVGGPLMADASSGNTQVFINGREISKAELRILKLAGVECAGNPHFWVNEDGSYREEGQKNIKEYMWGKAGTKLACALLSLPLPSKSCGEASSSRAAPDYLSKPCGEASISRAVPGYLLRMILQKILLVGYNGSGTGTIFKQAKILYKAVPFPDDERESIKLKIQRNVYGYLGILLEGRERFEDESLAEMKKQRSYCGTDSTGNPVDDDAKILYSISPRLKSFSDWLLETLASGNPEDVFPATSCEWAPRVEELWKDAAFQATYERSSELEMLPIHAPYFLQRVVYILRTDYEPSDLDILLAEGVPSSTGFSCLDFSFPPSASSDGINAADQLDSLPRYQLIRVSTIEFEQNNRLLEMFEDIRMVIFCVALSDYDLISADGNGESTNKMLLARSFFERIVAHPTLEQMDFLLILNKFDLFEEKIERVPLNRCDWFNDFHPVISLHPSNNNSISQLASHYIAVKFKRLYSSLTGMKLYVSVVNGLESNSVDASLRYAREILKWYEEQTNFSSSNEARSSSD